MDRGIGDDHHGDGGEEVEEEVRRELARRGVTPYEAAGRMLLSDYELKGKSDVTGPNGATQLSFTPSLLARGRSPYYIVLLPYSSSTTTLIRAISGGPPPMGDSVSLML